GFAIVVAPGEDAVTGAIVGLAVGFWIHRRVGKELAAIIAMRADPQAQAIAGAQHWLVLLDAIPRGRVELEIVDQPGAGAVGMAGADDSGVELLGIVGAEEDVLAGQLFAAISAHRVLRKGLIDEHV